MILSYNDFVNENDSWVGNSYTARPGCVNWGSKDINIKNIFNDFLEIEGKYLDWNGKSPKTKDQLDEMPPTWDEYHNNKKQYENPYDCQMKYYLMNDIKRMPIENIIFAEEKSGRSGGLKWDDYCDFKIVDGPNKNVLYIENTQKGSPDACRCTILNDFLNLLSNSGKNSVSISYMKDDKKVKINSVLLEFRYRPAGIDHGDFQRKGFDGLNLVFIRKK